MPRARRLALACALALSATPALADLPTAALASPASRDHHPIRRSDATGRRASSTSGAWWGGPAGVVLALAVLGGVSVAARRFRGSAAADTGSLRVVGRAALSPRHAVYLLKIGERTLVVGTGPQGAPSLLGEWPEAARTPAAGGPR